jgi:hypothetical protein
VLWGRFPSLSLYCGYNMVNRARLEAPEGSSRVGWPGGAETGIEDIQPVLLECSGMAYSGVASPPSFIC